MEVFWPQTNAYKKDRVRRQLGYIDALLGGKIKILVKFGSQSVKHSGRFAMLLMASVGAVFAQKPPQPTRVWSVGPLTKSEPVMGLSLGAGGARLTGPFVDSQTGSDFAATRSVVFSGDRIVLTSRVGERRVGGTQNSETVYQLLSLDVRTGEVRDTREIAALMVFATNDAHIIVSQDIVSRDSVLRLTPDLKDAGSFEYQAEAKKYWRLHNISPDGSTLGIATHPGYLLLDAQTLKTRRLTTDIVEDTSVSSKAVVDFEPSLKDEKGEHSIFHGRCVGKPMFLSDDLLLTATCKVARILDTQGKVLKTISFHDSVAFAGVSQNGKRFALQVASFTRTGELRQEHLVIYSTDTGEPIAEVTPDGLAMKQSWTAFSPDGSMFVVGSPLTLTLFRLP
jgi:hypothetical protein